MGLGHLMRDPAKCREDAYRSDARGDFMTARDAEHSLRRIGTSCGEPIDLSVGVIDVEVLADSFEQ